MSAGCQRESAQRYFIILGESFRRSRRDVSLRVAACRTRGTCEARPINCVHPRHGGPRSFQSLITMQRPSIYAFGSQAISRKAASKERLKERWRCPGCRQTKRHDYAQFQKHVEACTAFEAASLRGDTSQSRTDAEDASEAVDSDAISERPERQESAAQNGARPHTVESSSDHESDSSRDPDELAREAVNVMPRKKAKDMGTTEKRKAVVAPGSDEGHRAKKHRSVPAITPASELLPTGAGDDDDDDDVDDEDARVGLAMAMLHQEIEAFRQEALRELQALRAELIHMPVIERATRARRGKGFEEDAPPWVRMSLA